MTGATDTRPSAERTAAPAGEFVRVEGLDIEFRRWPGADVPILLLHEALGSVSMWRDFPDRLAEATGREVIAWSRAGHGASDPTPTPRDEGYFDREATSGFRLMDALGIHTAHLFGHSDGTSIALTMAARHPERVAGLALEAPHVTVERQTIAAIRKVKEIYAAGDMKAKLGRHHRDPDHVFRGWHELWLDPQFAGWSMEDVLPLVEAPVLLIQGCDDEYFSMQQLDRIQAGVPHARRLELADCGHSPHRHQPDAVIASALELFERLSVWRAGNPWGD